MSDFYTETVVKAVRKPHYCYECRTTINAGESAIKCVQLFNGDFHSDYTHEECLEASRDYNNKLLDLYPGDEWYRLCDMENREDWVWLIKPIPEQQNILIMKNSIGKFSSMIGPFCNFMDGSLVC